MEVAFKFQALDKDAQLPTRSYEGDAGWDLYVLHSTTVGVGEFVDLGTGVAVELPPGVWGEIAGRSSTLRDKGLLVIHGVIDNGWRGELLTGVRNLQSYSVEVEAGERLAQLIPHLLVEGVAEWVDEVAPADRGIKGFGSSGR